MTNTSPKQLERKITEWYCSQGWRSGYPIDETVRAQGWYAVRPDDFCEMPEDVVDAVIELASLRFDIQTSSRASVLRWLIDGEMTVSIRPTWYPS
ncbi:MAG: hypothetical protein Q8K86_08160 [Candidatus Nanopelagicaceae bacterium]|nr:hypothetical protein [Candidatus Nanopelagicaceae bacterium]